MSFMVMMMTVVIFRPGSADFCPVIVGQTGVKIMAVVLNALVMCMLERVLSKQEWP